MRAQDYLDLVAKVNAQTRKARALVADPNVQNTMATVAKVRGSLTKGAAVIRMVSRARDCKAPAARRIVRPTTRRRGAGRPRSRVRSSSRGGDSGDGEPHQLDVNRRPSHHRPYREEVAG